MAKNEHDSKIGISISQTTTQGTVSSYLELDDEADFTQQLRDFPEGEIAIAPTAATVEVGAGSFSRVTGAFKLVYLGATVTLLKGLTFKIEKAGSESNGGFQVTIDSTSRIREADLTITDVRGSEVTAKVAFDDEAGGMVSFPIPSGVDLDPAAMNVTLTLGVEE
jgi:hypothetical protein